MSASPPKRAKVDPVVSSGPCWATSGPSAVLEFWFGSNFGASCDTVAYLDERFGKWFAGRDALFDIRQLEAAAAIEAAALGELRAAEWETSRGLLAQLLLCDQFARSAFRGTARAFASDTRAIEVAQRLVDSGAFDDSGKFRAVERFFVCVALSHSEDLAPNRLHVELAKRIGGRDTLPEVAAYFANLKGFPHEHFECISRFGRFPHRNVVLGRESTADELQWLASPECPGWARSQQQATLTYWRGRGLGEPIRMLLHFACVPFQDVFVNTCAEFEQLKADGALPFGQVPLYTAGGVSVVQTQAILRHVARKRGLDGDGPDRAADADMISNAVLDARVPLITARFQPDAKVALGKFLTTTLPKIAGQLEQWLATRGADGKPANFFAGQAPTYADVLVLEFLEYVADEAPEDVAASSSLAVVHPLLFGHWRRMREFQHVSEYICSPTRVPKPDDAFVRTTCGILGMDLPKYLTAEVA
mmetsp:Transcript_178540/g.572200  ORF Transcript_178540/g.572200 Transcript_178540/m.572200 type:complete len:476 (+) Transcript_178540:173-1600(+)